MQFHISFEVYDSLIDSDAVAQAQDQAGQVFARFLKDPRISASGHFVGKRGGFIVMEADTADEIAQLIGPLLDLGRFQIEPIVGFDKLLGYFEQAKQARKG